MPASAAARARAISARYQTQPAIPGRADQQRQRVLFAEKGDAGVAARDVGEHPRQKFYAIQRSAVVAHRDLVLAAAVAEFEHRLGQAPARHTAQILDVECLARQIAHALPRNRQPSLRSMRKGARGRFQRKKMRAIGWRAG